MTSNGQSAFCSPMSTTGRRTAPNRVRDARKREISELRVQVEALSASLAALVDLKKRPKSKSLSVWEEVCSNQRRHREKAERDNKRLRVAVEKRETQVEALQHALEISNRKLGELQASRWIRGVTNASLAFESNEHAEIFGQLEAAAADAYRDVDAVLRLNGLSRNLMEPAAGTRFEMDEDEPLLDLSLGSLLPFEVSKTAASVWRCLSGEKKHHGPLYFKRAQTSHDQVQESFAVEMHVNQLKVDFRVRQVVRRYTNGNRVVVVWAGALEPHRFANKVCWRSGFRSTGYMVCEPVNGASGFTRFRRCQRISPYTPHKLDTARARRAKRDFDFIMEFIKGVDGAKAHLHHIQDELMLRSMHENK